MRKNILTYILAICMIMQLLFVPVVIAEENVDFAEGTDYIAKVFVWNNMAGKVTTY